VSECSVLSFLIVICWKFTNDLLIWWIDRVVAVGLATDKFACEGVLPGWVQK
jgi:hypothetical protein